MPPKVDPDVKLNQLRSYVASNVRQLASTGKTSLKGIFSAKRTSEEGGFYEFLWSSEHAFTDVQRAHADETLALVTQHSVNSGDAHPAAVLLGAGAKHNSSCGLESRAGAVSSQAGVALFGRRLRRRTTVRPQAAPLQLASSSSSGGTHPAAITKVRTLKKRPAAQHCFQVADEQPHAKKPRISSDMSSGGSHPAARATPARDRAILQDVNRLGRMPREIKHPKTEEEKWETNLCYKIRYHWPTLQSETRSYLDRLADVASGCAEVKAKIAQMPPDTPQELMRILLVLSQGPTWEVILKEKGTDLWRNSGCSLRCAIPSSIAGGTNNKLRRLLSREYVLSL